MHLGACSLNTSRQLLTSDIPFQSVGKSSVILTYFPSNKGKDKGQILSRNDKYIYFTIWISYSIHMHELNTKATGIVIKFKMGILYWYHHLIISGSTRIVMPHNYRKYISAGVEELAAWREFPAQCCGFLSTWQTGMSRPLATTTRDPPPLPPLGDNS